MARRKQPSIPDALLDQLLAGADPKSAFAKDGLIPITVQPDGKTWAPVRVKPNQEWFLTNTFSF